MTTTARIKGRLPPRLSRCPRCQQHIFSTAKRCPHCDGELKVLQRKQLNAIKRAEAALATLQRVLGG